MIRAIIFLLIWTVIWNLSFAQNITKIESKQVTFKYWFIHKPTIFKVYKNLFPIDIEVKNDQLIYNNKILYKNLIQIAKSLWRNDIAAKLDAARSLWEIDAYLGELYNLTWNLNNYNPKYFSTHRPYVFNFNKNIINLSVKNLLNSNPINFQNGKNIIVICYSTNLDKYDFESNKSLLFKNAFCSIPKVIYYYHGKYFLDKNKYEEYKKYYDAQQNWHNNFKYNLEYNKFKYFHLEDLLEKIKNIVKDYVNKNYKIGMSNKLIEIQENELAKNLTNKFAIYKWIKIVPDKLDFDDFEYFISYYYNLYTKQIDNNYYSQVNQKEQYKSEALSNYWELQKRYNQLKQEYEQYKLKTAENRQRAIKLTVVLTKILSKYHDKETKLKLLDKIDQIIETKYWPDNFKNQDLIWYVKDYLKIIKLAIQLS